ncbi:MAG: aromatic amino acid lyase, partial [Solirubrobacterales bacterium]|nr:aromatic amino acid lyase [Solirubrobacterales bacterium]
MAAVADQRLGGHRRHQVGQVGQLAGRADGQAGKGAHERGAVGQRKALFGLEHKGLDPERGQHLRRRAPLAVERHKTIPGQGPPDVGQGRQVPARSARPALGIEPFMLEAKEGLALTNGTSFMSAFACLAVGAA